MNSFDLIKKIHDENKKSDDDLNKALNEISKENEKDALAIKSEIYKHIASKRYDVIDGLLDILGQIVKKDEVDGDEHKNNFFRRLGK